MAVLDQLHDHQPVDLNDLNTLVSVLLLSAIKSIVNTDEYDKHQAISHQIEGEGSVQGLVFFALPSQSY